MSKEIQITEAECELLEDAIGAMDAHEFRKVFNEIAAAHGVTLDPDNGGKFDRLRNVLIYV